MPRLKHILIGLACLVVAGIAAILFWDAIPGTFFRDSNGFPHGTGRAMYKYRAGGIQLVEDYSRGKLVRSEWFKPDGASIHVTNWNKESGVGLYLREDGSIRKRMFYVAGVADGPVIYYAEDGTTVIGEAVFKGGVRISGYDPGKSKE